jgi:hypothetical protein
MAQHIWGAKTRDARASPADSRRPQAARTA